jgi:hypothetical protein
MCLTQIQLHFFFPPNPVATVVHPKFSNTALLLCILATPGMARNNKRPRLQKTVAKDIAPRDLFTHSSNTSTRTRQITTSILAPSNPTHTTSSLLEMDLELSTPGPSVDFSETYEIDPPAGVEVFTKGRRYLNSVSTN